MNKRKVFEVLPKDGDWSVKLDGNKKASKNFEVKEKAIDYAKERAKEENLSQVRIHNQKGIIQTEYTYGKDPRNIKG